MSEQPASLPPLATLDDELYDMDETSEDDNDDATNTCQPMSLDHLLRMHSVQDKRDKIPRRVELIPYTRPMTNSAPKLTANHAGDEENKLSKLLMKKAKKCTQVEDEDNEIDDDERLIMENMQEDNIKQEQPKIITNTKNDDQMTLSDSLEQLVNSFDEQVRGCLRDLQADITGLAPVQKRSQEEVIKDRISWLTLTGNYGDIAPIDWRKLSPTTDDDNNCFGGEAPPSTPQLDFDLFNDEQLRELISACIEPNFPRQTADAVLEEIDALMMGTTTPSTTEHGFDRDCPDVTFIRKASFYSFSLEKLKSLTTEQLQELAEDFETKVAQQSEKLVQNLARRDELEFEKEIKNTFLRQLLQVQNSRRTYLKKQQAVNNNNIALSKRQRYLTTVIPYQKGHLTVPVLQSLIKILKSMNEDSPAVPTLLTDYILTHVCPTSTRICATMTATSLSSSSSNKYRFIPAGLTTAFASATTDMLGGRLRSVARRSLGSLTSLRVPSNKEKHSHKDTVRTAQAVA